MVNNPPSIEEVVLLVAFAAGVVIYSFNLWFHPRKFLRRHRRLRQRAHSSSIGFLARTAMNRGFDRSPAWELLVGRIVFIVFYVAIIYLGTADFRS